MMKSFKVFTYANTIVVHQCADQEEAKIKSGAEPETIYRIKEMSDWDYKVHLIGSGETVEIGEEMYNNFLNALPPIRWTGSTFYLGEAYDNGGTNGRARYFYCYVKDGKHMCQLRTIQ